MTDHTPTRTTDLKRIALAFPDRPADHKMKLPLVVDHHGDGAHDADGVSIFVTNPCGGTEYPAHIVRCVNAHEMLMTALHGCIDALGPYSGHKFPGEMVERAEVALALARGENDG